MNDSIKSITFFKPSKIVGGCEYLFIRLAAYLAEDCNIKVYYVDYKDGFARKQLSLNNVNFIDYSDEEKIQLNFETHLITNLGAIYQIYKNADLSDKVNLFFWNVFIYDCLLPLPFLGYFIEKFNPKLSDVKKFLNLLYRKDVHKISECFNLLSKNYAMVYMDLPNFQNTNFCLDLGQKDPNFLQILALNSDHTPVTNIISKDTINIGWLGRLATFKIYSLINILENANLYSEKFNKKIKVHIIGTGPKENIVRNFSISPNVELVFSGTIINNELDQYLLNNVDILFAMGTSALEGAKLHVPSVLVDFNYERIDLDYKFNWLFETEKYGLGQDIKELKKPNNHSFEEILGKIYLENNKELIGNQCFQYFRDNHSIDIVAKKLIGYLNQNKMTIEEFKKTGILEFYDKCNKFSFLKKASFIKKLNRLIFHAIMKINLVLNPK